MLDSIKISGFIVLFVGVAVLVFTFYNAYLFLMGVLKIPTGELMEVFGEALAPLVETCIRAIYLGIMGWIGSILTRRGVQTVTFEREKTEVKVAPKVKEEPKTEVAPKVEEKPKAEEKAAPKSEEEPKAEKKK